MPLIYVSAPNYYYTYDLPTVPGAEVYVGTSPQCQLSLPGVEGLGEVHASIVCQPQGYVITDLGTPYGTLANGVPVQADYLRPGVEYRLGSLAISVPMEGAVQQQPAQAAPQQAPAQQPSPAKKAVVKKASPLKTGGSAKGAASKADMANTADRFKRKGDSALFNMIYVIVLITAAVYAGVALRHWQKTGNYLPGIQADAEPGK